MAVFKSTDHGENWSALPQPELWSSGKIAFDSEDSPSLYVYDAYNINRSTDGGQHWSKLQSPYSSSAYMNELAFDPQNLSIIHAALYSYNVATAQYVLTYGISTDGGTIWTLKRLCTDSSDAYGYAYAVAVAKNNPNIIYIGGYEYSSDSGNKPRFFKSSDGGTTFQDRSLPSYAYYVIDIVIDPSDTNKVYAGTPTGVYRTTDGGLTWTPNDYYIPSVNSLSLIGGTLYAATSGGPYQSIDGGKSWTSLTSTGLSGIGGVGIIVENPSGTNLFYANAAGVFRSTNSGASWQSCHSGIIAGQISAIYIPPSAPTTLYASINNNSLYKTTNATSTPVTWERFDKFFTCATVCSMVSPPDDPDKLYALEGGG
jgi:photosystem II stability/assembly factor-like uncharacterized protein